MHRRQFLSAAATGVLASIAATRSRFESELASTDALPAPDDYTLAEGLTYLNHGAVGTVPRIVQEAHGSYLAALESNPWLYQWSGVWDEPLAETRAGAARLLGCAPHEVVLNRNTTDGFNLLATGLSFDARDEVLFSNLNHSGASVCWEQRAEEGGFAVRRVEIPPAAAPTITTEEIVELHAAGITESTRVLVVPHVDNQVGIRTPLAALARAAREAGVEYIFVDGAQSAAMLDFDLSVLDVDAYCCSPHKWVQAPKGTGMMYLSASLQERLRPQTLTWGQERWSGSERIFEDYGTRDMSKVLALGDAIRFQEEAGIAATESRRRELWQHARERVDAERGLSWTSPVDWELGSALFTIGFEGEDAREVASRLWEEDAIVVRPFHSEGRDVVRVTPNTMNSEAQLDRLIERLPRSAG